MYERQYCLRVLIVFASRCLIVTLHTVVEIVNFCIWRPPQDATLPQLPTKFYIMPIIEKYVPPNSLHWNKQLMLTHQFDALFCRACASLGFMSLTIN